MDREDKKYIDDGTLGCLFDNESLDESKQDIEKFKQWAGEELANRFFKVKDRLKGELRDIYYWLSLEKKLGPDKELAHQNALDSLEYAITDVEVTPTKKERQELAKSGSEKIYNDDRWLVLKINTFEASVKYGKHTQWCITGTNSGMDGGRSDWRCHSGSTFYFFIDKKNNTKYALEYYDDNDWCLWDESDYPMVGKGSNFNSALDVQGEAWNPIDQNKIPNFPKINGLPDLVQEFKDVAKDEYHYDKQLVVEEKENDIIDFAMKNIGTSDKPVDGPSYIMPNGKYLTIWRSKIPVSKYSSSGSATHRDVQQYLYDNGLVKDDFWNVEDPDLERLGCIRVNSGFEEYIWLPDNRPNETQWQSLLVWLDWYFAFHKKITVGYYHYAPKTYFASEYTTDEILKKCKEAYARGYLTESIKDIKQEILDNLDKLKDLYSDYYIEDLKDKNDFNVYVWGKGVSEFDVDVLVNKKFIRFKSVHIKDNAQNKGTAMKLIDAILSTLEGDWTIEVVANINASFWNHIAGKYTHFKWIGLTDVDESLVEKIVKKDTPLRFKLVDTEQVDDNLTYLDIKVGIDGDNEYLTGALFVECGDEIKVDLTKQINKHLLAIIKDRTNYKLEDKDILSQIKDFVTSNRDSIEKFNKAHKLLGEKIVKVGNKYQVQSEKGRNMGTYDTKEEAEKRLKQVHYFKYKNESLQPVDIEDDDLATADLIICDSPYQVNDFLSKQDFFKISYYPEKDFYVLIDPWNATHFDVNKELKKNGWIDSIDEEFDRMAYVALEEDIEDALGEYSRSNFENMSYIQADDGSVLVFLDSPVIYDNQLARIFKQVSSRKGVLSDLLNESLKESTGFPITVYTYQKPQVKELLEKGETYIASYDRANYNHYGDLAKVLGLSNCPIFGALSKEDLYDMLDSSGIDWEDENILHLEIPKENLKYTEYYDWTDYMYALDDPEEFKEESGLSVEDLENMLRTQKSAIDYDVCQVVFDRIESKWYQDGKDEEDAFLSESTDKYENIVKIELNNLNKWLDDYGFEVELVNDYKFNTDDVGMFLGEIQDNASMFPIALNKNQILNLCEKYDILLDDAILGTLWHEAGHGIYRYLQDFYDLDEDEEEVVEEFAREQEDSYLFKALQDYMKSE